MSRERDFRVLTVGWPQQLLDGLCADIEAASPLQFEHVAHPRHYAANWTGRPDGVHFFRDGAGFRLPAADAAWLASLEADGVPSVHNMILGDRVLRRVEHGAALRYATFVSRRLVALYEAIAPSVVIGGFDSLHGGMSLAVARRLGIPWFALHFSVIPPGYACFCDRMSPAARVALPGADPAAALRLADEALRAFEARKLQAYAYAPPSRTLLSEAAALPARLASLARIARLARDRGFARFVERETRYDPVAALQERLRSARARRAVASIPRRGAPPAGTYVLFGLHMQPESSIDVWAPFQSNQAAVIEQLARSIPPTHKLLVKIHKSDVANHTRDSLARLSAWPGVELVHPAADTRSLIEGASLVVAIQGTIGLEAALLGRPVIMLGESAVSRFPSAAQARSPDDLPALVRRQVDAPAPERARIVEAFARYLEPFMPASHNDWRTRKSTEQAAGFARLFDALREHLQGGRRAAVAP